MKTFNEFVACLKLEKDKLSFIKEHCALIERPNSDIDTLLILMDYLDEEEKRDFLLLLKSSFLSEILDCNEAFETLTRSLLAHYRIILLNVLDAEALKNLDVDYLLKRITITNFKSLYFSLKDARPLINFSYLTEDKKSYIDGMMIKSAMGAFNYSYNRDILVPLNDEEAVFFAQMPRSSWSRLSYFFTNAAILKQRIKTYSDLAVIVNLLDKAEQIDFLRKFKSDGMNKKIDDINQLGAFLTIRSIFDKLHSWLSRNELHVAESSLKAEQANLMKFESLLPVPEAANELGRHYKKLSHPQEGNLKPYLMYLVFERLDFIENELNTLNILSALHPEHINAELDDWFEGVTRPALTQNQVELRAFSWLAEEQGKFQLMYIVRDVNQRQVSLLSEDLPETWVPAFFSLSFMKEMGLKPRLKNMENLEFFVQQIPADKVLTSLYNIGMKYLTHLISNGKDLQSFINVLPQLQSLFLSTFTAYLQPEHHEKYQDAPSIYNQMCKHQKKALELQSVKQSDQRFFPSVETVGVKAGSDEEMSASAFGQSRKLLLP